MTALAASIGTGNIAGVATAIVSGGPGALFWIWAYGFVATAVKFSEAVLGMRFREVNLPLDKRCPVCGPGAAGPAPSTPSGSMLDAAVAEAHPAPTGSGA